MEWISVEKKRPESAAPVLIVAGPYMTRAVWNAQERRFEMLSREDDGLISSEFVTHWMPMPEFPKERHNDWDRELLLCEGVTVENRLGATPVEYSGKADDKSYYFRSRGEVWEMIIGDTVGQCVKDCRSDHPLENSEFYCTGRYGKEEFDAGYMPLEQAEEIIRRCVRLWRAAKREA